MAESAALIQTQTLTKHYGHDVLALDSLSVEIGTGVTGVVGTSGGASMLGYDVLSQGPTLRQFVGYMPEHDCLPPDVSATDFVAHMARINGLPKAAARERTAEILRHVGLFEERYRAIGTYSTGM